MKKAIKTSDLVDISELDPTIKLHMIYATKDNFTGQAVYPSPLCFFRPKVATKLKEIQNRLRERGLGLKIYDGYRPHSVQKFFFSLFPNPDFVADPAIGSNHNRAAAVDLTLIDLKTGQELEMPTAVDAFVKEAHSYYPDLSAKILQNRSLLQYYMVQGGFEVLPKEWWHFNCTEAGKYEILDVPFDLLDL